MIDTTLDGWRDRLKRAGGDGGFDVIFDAGAESPSVALEVLAPKGTLVLYGSLSLSSFALGPADIAPLIFKNASIRGFALPTLLTPAGLHVELPRLLALAAAKELRVTIGGRWPLKEAAEAHKAMESRATQGKLLLVPDHN